MLTTAVIPQPLVQSTQILAQLKSGQIFRVKGGGGTAMIICHRHHAELAGPGAVVGGAFDLDCCRLIPIGNVSLVYAESRAERQQGYAIRQKWLGFTQKAMDSSVPLQRARHILILLERYFGAEKVSSLPDEVLAQLVGVLPKTLAMARRVNHPQVESPQKEPQLIAV